MFSPSTTESPLLFHEAVPGTSAPSILFAVTGNLEGVLPRLASEPVRDQKLLFLSASLPRGGGLQRLAQQILDQFQEMRIKKVSLLGIGDGGNLIQAIAVLGSRIVRHAVLINPTTRMAPSRGQILLDKLERVLPLGLPLRTGGTDFDSRPMLHRLRCPTLVLTDPTSTPFQAHQAELIAQAIPNAWRESLADPFLLEREVPAQIWKVVEAFLESPAKRPQKNRP